MHSDKEIHIPRPGWRARCTRWLAPFMLLLPGVVCLPVEAATDPWAAGAGSLWLRTAAEAEPVASLVVDTAMQVRVTGSVARVEVTQRFTNPLDAWVEGLYVFPLSAAAAVDGMEMQIGDRVIRGEIQPRAAARATYDAALAAGRRASLVDQHRPNMFTTAVANIPPRGAVTVRIAYLELIPWRDARYTLKLPLAITPRYTPGATATPERVTAPLQQARIEVELAPGFVLDSLRSHHHPVAVAEDAGRGSFRIAALRAAADRDFELSWAPVIAPDTMAAVYAEQHDGTTHALVLLTPPEAPAGAAPPREVIFIIDTSGSMGGPPIAQAQAALALGIAQLGPRDSFNIIRFSSEARALFPESRPADAQSRELAQRFVASLQASGGTEMRPALELAFGMPVAAEKLRQIVFITDGSVGNEAEIVALIQRRLGDARLFTVGIGAAPNAWFMQEAAAAGRGSYTFIAEAGQAGERMVELFRKLERPALVGLELHWPGGGRPELATPLPRDLYAGDPLVVAVRFGAEPLQGMLTLSGQDGGGAWVRQVPIVALAGEAGIARLWARERIAELARRKRLGGRDTDASELDGQVLALALAYGVVSELTSLVAVDATPARPPGAPGRLEQAPTSAPAGGAWGRSAGFPVTATAAPLLSWLGAIALLLAGLLSVAGRVRQRAQ